jgi:hypothetical protein
MLIALNLGCRLFFTGQTSTHKATAGAIFRGYLERVGLALYSLKRASEPI